MSLKDPLKQHKELAGKIEMALKAGLDNADDLSTYYTPGVGAVSSYLADHPEEVRDYTWLNNSVAVISDGSSVLGLGDIGPQASLPVMEGKCMLFKKFAGIDAVPVVLDVHSPDEIVNAIKAIASGFGGINLEDIAAPICFEVERKLKRELEMPIMHDDQHGTAIVVLAGLINALKITGKQLKDCKLVINGAGAAGIAIARLLKKYQPDMRILLADSHGALYAGRENLNPVKQHLLSKGTIVSDEKGELEKIISGSDIFIGVSRGNVVSGNMIRSMADKPIVFAMANPTPEIMPDEAKKAGAAVVATGRSDFANQVNNALAFPGIFRGALDSRVNRITSRHKIDAARVIASLVENPDSDNIMPSIFDERLVPQIAKVIT
ncbi:MAG TPA: NADP-dependent malic enzyme [Candidatus Saccharimonadales bacterium]|nr:NADP-dependent malic enzyme [Candidatus Saccharimonadales bacterium]